MASPTQDGQVSSDSQKTLSSPEAEEDLTEQGLKADWQSQTHDDSNRTTSHNGEALSSKWKGKQRQLDPLEENVEDDASGSEAQDETGPLGYPPTQDSAAESRRVEENLRRWELAERERRRHARESAADTAPPSVFGAVGRRASLLWPNRKNSINNTSRRTPRPSEADYPVRLSSIDNSPSSSLHASPTPSSSPSPRASSSFERGIHPSSNDNPFDTDTTPTSSAPLAYSPFIDPPRNNSPQLFSIMQGSSKPPTPGVTGVPQRKGTETVNGRPVLEASSSFMTGKPPPPAPLDLPPPKTPPPRFAEPEDTPPSTPRASAPQPRKQSNEGPDAEGRWWTDWLCGCRESDDSTDQAGRTNPFE